MNHQVFAWRSGNRFELLLDGQQFFPRLLAAIAAAEQQVELELYLVEDGACAAELVAALTAMIATQWPEVTIGLLGRPRDREVATRVALLSREPLLNWFGQLGLADTLALLGHAAAVVTSESQYMHLAAALGRPHVAIYGAVDAFRARIASTAHGAA